MSSDKKIGGYQALRDYTMTMGDEIEKYIKVFNGNAKADYPLNKRGISKKTLRTHILRRSFF